LLPTGPMASSAPRPPPGTVTDPSEILERHFGHASFRPGQREAIDATLAGRDVVAVMPTGSGKSVCYQVPALAREGPALVVSPLIALMKDQVDALQEAGVAATFINSSIDAQERGRRVEGLAKGEWELVYIAPERLRSSSFRASLARARVGLLAIDEAHCISTWGHDFRPDYLRLGELLRAVRPAPVIACTATATAEVRDDIVRRLGLSDPMVLVRGFRRENLFLSVERVRGAEDKLRRARDHLRQALDGGGSALVYCSTRKRAEEVAAGLRRGGVSAEAYHAGMDKEERKAAQDRFMTGSTDCVVATNAFGMGVDKGDVRLVVHHDLPGSPEAYYQEVGRAGRDGRPSRCVLLFNHGDLHVRRFLIESSNPPEDVVRGLVGQLREEVSRGGGVAHVDASTLAARCPVAQSERQVWSALMALERAGVLERGTTGDGGPTIRLLGGAQGEAVDFEALRRRADREHDKLRKMVRYSTGFQCRHRYILVHFGDPEAAACADSCDVCLRAARGAVGDAGGGALDDDQVLAVRKALSAVARLRARYGMGRVASVLTGGRDQKLVDAGLDQLPTYGALSDWRRADVLILLETLVAAGCCDVRGREYPTVGISALGVEVMKAETPPPMLWPDLDTAGPAARRRRSSPGPAAGALELSDEDRALFEQLRELRSTLAKEREVPAYVVASDRTLVELAQRRPQDENQLLDVHGIGPGKVQRYGARFLAALRG